MKVTLDTVRLRQNWKTGSSNCLSLCKKVDVRKDVELMSEQDIWLALLEWRDKWDKELENLKFKKEKLKDEDLYDIDDHNEQIQGFRNNYDNVSETVAKKYK